jgi:hypothetical protein
MFIYFVFNTLYVNVLWLYNYINLIVYNFRYARSCVLRLINYNALWYTYSIQYVILSKRQIPNPNWDIESCFFRLLLV